MNEVRPRVTGTEIEWPVGLRYADNDYYEQATGNVVNLMVKYVTKSDHPYHEMLVNGGRCYLDGNVLEYATGEDDSFMGTVANEIAGEQLVDEAVAEFVADNSDIDNYQLMKRVYFNRNATTGYHINLCGDASKFRMNENDLYDLGLWAATASMYTGAGFLYEEYTEGPIRYAIGQKTSDVKVGFSTGTMSSKPLICLRNEPLSDPDRFHRVQIVGMDTNISPWASWMALGTASLCLRAIEQSRKTGLQLQPRVVDRGIVKYDPFAELARKVTFNPNLNSITKLADGRTISAIDIQRELYRQASKTDHTDEEAEILKNWERVLNDVDGDRAFMKSRVGWMVRQQKLAKYAQRHELSETAPELLLLDRKWDAIGKQSVAEVLRSTLWQNDMPDAKIIKTRRDNPCPNTRAVLRSAAIREIFNYDSAYIEWSSYKLGQNKEVYLTDPLMTKLPEVGSLNVRKYEPDDEDMQY